MSDAIRTWMIALEDYPGWKKWRRQRMAYTLYYDDPFPPKRELGSGFMFSDQIDKQHAVILQYLGLQQTVLALKETDFYFRRYPFRDLPVSRYSHITNICEMYFGRFYELKERLKKYFEAMKAVTPHHRIEAGAFIKLFGKVFDQELRARNGIHHHAASRISRLSGSFSPNPFRRSTKRRAGSVNIWPTTESSQTNGPVGCVAVARTSTNLWKRLPTLRYAPANSFHLPPNLIVRGIATKQHRQLLAQGLQVLRLGVFWFQTEPACFCTSSTAAGIDADTWGGYLTQILPEGP